MRDGLESVEAEVVREPFALQPVSVRRPYPKTPGMGSFKDSANVLTDLARRTEQLLGELDRTVEGTRNDAHELTRPLQALGAGGIVGRER